MKDLSIQFSVKEWFNWFYVKTRQAAVWMSNIGNILPGVTNINMINLIRIKRDDNSRRSYLQESSNLASLAQHDNIVTMIAGQ